MGGESLVIVPMILTDATGEPDLNIDGSIDKA